MEKRYQVFISSTFADLQDERKAIMESIMDLDCFPAGMEMFPANDSEQFEYIKTIIDASDYYVLIIAGRYGSLADDGKSYTEKEFDYAKEKGIPVLVFVKKDLENIPLSKTDGSEEKMKKLKNFIEKAMKNRLAKYWGDSKELKYEVHSSLSKAFKTHPRTGWVRGNIANNENLLNQINDLRIENERLRKSINEYENECCVATNELAEYNDIFKLLIRVEPEDGYEYEEELDITWDEIIGIIGPGLFTSKIDSELKSYLEETLISKTFDKNGILTISEYNYNRIKMQLIALNIIEQNGSFLKLTNKGKNFLLSNKTQKK
ncbi:DUF4062 domain-containing protein [Clostridium perfringens]|uniref:DUF4062 domain-containing protein n=4 Tax=Clostridium perfringens TaxID=1502 RepID=A0A127EGQ6_CLOPF|nr:MULTISPECIES: DUF4062 domain-containing protein [Clostridium]AMN35161.1 hypothetical protein JFP838_05135 [Clostridium perfringens]EIL8447035.1 DUF4062 domain-containing protein [Clostridium perfringens]MDK7589516.1 DUF4062 domain-containing protein [Clostridium sp. UMB9555B]MDK7628091.1 DUF4062 domain-containing protein [Clostridium sp. UMB9555A]MDM0711681.1 DUF4062 domain-containing protein [Clostridium perfringens]